MTIIPVAIVAGVWCHLAKQGSTTQTIWLGCNVLDTLRALRLIRPNGRAVGQRTRRKAMQEALACWVTYVVVQYLGSLPDRLLGWLPVYSLLRAVVVSCFLLVRVSTSETMYYSIIQPVLRRYKTPIDLTLELVTSLTMLVYHFTLEYPLAKLRSATAPYTATATAVVKSTTGSSIFADNNSSSGFTSINHAEHAPDSFGEVSITVPGSFDRRSKISTPKAIEQCLQQSPARPVADGTMPLPLPRSVTRLRPSQSNLGSPSRPRVPRPLPIDMVTVHQDPLSKAPSAGAQVDTVTKATASTRVRSIASAINKVDKPAPIVAREPLRQATKRPAPINRNVNLPRADPPLVKAKSVNHLKPSKPLDAPPKRPTKSSPLRVLTVHDDPNSARAKRLASAAARAKEIRERKRREPGVTPGEKRGPTPLKSEEMPGSKRTKFTVARD